MRGPAVRPVVIAAGGTAGHLFPAEALAAELVARNRRVVLLTDSRTAARARETFAGREQFAISGAGIAGRGRLRAAAAAFAIGAGTLAARGILARLDAAALIGFGGYPSVAPVLAARLLPRRPPMLLHEQNAVLGRANRALARLADTLALSFAATARIPAGVRTVLTGNPVRPAIAALAGVPYAPPGPDQAVRLLVLGGSLGARVMSDVVPQALAALPGSLRARLRLVQQCRGEDLARVREACTIAGIDAELATFFSDMPARLEAAHLVIARAGASTVAELAAIGRPAILVPLPGAIDDHQSANARALAESGAAMVIAERDLTPALLSERLAGLLAAPELLADAAIAAAAIGRADAAARLADHIEATIGQESRR